MTTFSFDKIFLIALVIGMTSACSTTRPYTSKAPENLLLKTEVQKGTAWLNIYEVDQVCATKYLGTVELEGSRVKVAIPTNKSTYLQFNFSNASLLSGQSTNAYGVYLTTRSGYQYDATVNYVDDMYSIKLHEQNSRSGTRQEITHGRPTACASK